MSYKLENIKAVFCYSKKFSCGFFSRVKQIDGLKSSEEQRNIEMDKSRFVFVKDLEDIFTNDTKMRVYERGSNQVTSSSSWKVEHQNHGCNHKLTIEDENFKDRFSNYFIQRDRNGISKRLKRMGRQFRCYEHKPEDGGKKTCGPGDEYCGPHDKDRCSNHDGKSCCGMNLDARIDQEGVRVSKNELFQGSLCSHENDKILSRQLFGKWN